MIYLTGSSGPGINAIAREIGVGLMLQPGNRSHHYLGRYDVWAADNGCFAKGRTFDEVAWLAWLVKLSAHATSCLFATAPDVLGDAAATWRRSSPALELIRERGYKAALVAQDGLVPGAVAWDVIDGLFIGGTTRWKLSAVVPTLVQAAKAEGKWVHMGRVNGYSRLRMAALIGCDSADGTFLKFSPDVNVPRLRAWLEKLHAQPQLEVYQPVNLGAPGQLALPASAPPRPR